MKYLLDFVKLLALLSDKVLMIKIEIDKKLTKAMKRVPKEILKKLAIWIKDVKSLGIEEVRKIPGWHDEPLEGKKKERRSIRLNKKWRAEYVEETDAEGKTILILEVHPHDY